MTAWTAYHIHYTDLDRFITACLYPFLQAEAQHLETYFWERHYAGGPHVRVRLRGTADALASVGARLVTTAERYLAAHPSADLDAYSEDTVADLMAYEGDDPRGQDLRYRNNVVLEQPYRQNIDKFASHEAAAFLEAFYHDVAPLVVAVLQAPRAKSEVLLRLFFVHCLTINEDYTHGGIPFRAHWEGVEMQDDNEAMVAAFTRTYETQRPALQAVMLDVQRAYRQDALDPILAQWRDLMADYRTRSRVLHTQGVHVAPYPTKEAHWREARDYYATNATQGALLNTMYEDKRFLLTLQYDAGFNEVRVSVNLLYLLVAAVGLRPADKFLLGFLTFRTIEDYYQTDLAGVLEQRIAHAIEQFADRLQDA